MKNSKKKERGAFCECEKGIGGQHLKPHTGRRKYFFVRRKTRNLFLNTAISRRYDWVVSFFMPLFMPQ